MPTPEGKVDAVIGVDTHRDAHAAAILDRNGGLVAQLQVQAARPAPAPPGVVAEPAPGFAAGRWKAAAARGWARQLPGRPGRVGREDHRPKWPRGRNGAKSDPLDVTGAGREALSRSTWPAPASVATGRRWGAQLTCSGASGRRRCPPAAQGAAGHRAEPPRLAGARWDLAAARPAPAPPCKPKPLWRWRTGRPCRRCRPPSGRFPLYAEAKELEKELAGWSGDARQAPTQPGVGPVTAAQLLISWSHPGRLRSEAAFAMLAGVAPVEASSARWSATG